MPLSFITRVRLAAALTVAMTLPLLAQEPSTDESPNPVLVKKPDLKKINESTYQLGEITINTKDRSISFPATAEITEGLIEYILVNPEGKVHESLFVTKASPTNLNVAFKLLGFQENKSLFKTLVDGQPTHQFQEANKEQIAQSYFKIDVSWTDSKSNKSVSHNLNTLIINDQTKSPIGTAQDTAKWTYGGSFISGGQFVAELNRDIIAVFTDRSAVANFAGTGRDDDSLWFPDVDKLPALGTDVSLVITPEFPAKQK